MVLTPGNSSKEIAVLEKVNGKLEQLLAHDPRDLSFDAMRSALAIRGSLDEIVSATDQAAVRTEADAILRRLDDLEEKVSTLAMIADIQKDVVDMNIEVIATLAAQREELAEDLNQARGEIESAFDDGYQAGVDMAGYGADPDAYGDDFEEDDLDETDEDETPVAELSEADKQARALERWAAWHDSLNPEELAEYRAKLTPEQRAWYSEWCGWNGE